MTRGVNWQTTVTPHRQTLIMTKTRRPFKSNKLNYCPLDGKIVNDSLNYLKRFWTIVGIMDRALVVGLVMSAVNGWQEAWPQAVIAVVKESFNRPVVLFLNNQDEQARRRTLMPESDFAKRARVLSALARNFSLIVANPDYVRPDEEFIRYRLGLVNAGQVIAILGKNTAADPDALRRTIQEWRNNAVWFGRAKIMIVIETPTDGDILAEKVIKELWRQVKSTNVLVLVASGELVQFYSFTPYDPTCTVTAKSVGTWNTTYRNYHVFPTWTFRDLNNCTLHVTATELIPYVFPPDADGEYTDGIEVRAFRELSRILNYSFKFVPVPEGENPWMTTINNTVVGFIGTLVRGDSDICLSGGRLNYERCVLADPLEPYINDDFVWVGPAAQRTPRWKAVFLVFSPIIWLAGGTTFIVSFLFAAFIYRKTFPTSTAFLVIWAASLSNTSPSNLMPTSSITRCFLAFFLFYTLTMNALYTSALYGALTNGFKLQKIDSNTEAADRGLTASIFPSNILDLQQTLPRYYKKITENNLVIWSNDYMPCFHRAARKGDCYTLFTGLGSRYHINMRFTSKMGRPFVRIMKNRYKSYVPTIYMARHHPLHVIFRRRLRQMVENGWIQVQAAHIMSESLRKRLTMSEVKDFSEIEEKKTLSLEQVFGAFLASSILLFVAAIVFCFEVWVDYRSRRDQYKDDQSVPGKLMYLH